MPPRNNINIYTWYSVAAQLLIVPAGFLPFLDSCTAVIINLIRYLTGILKPAVPARYIYIYLLHTTRYTSFAPAWRRCSTRYTVRTYRRVGTKEAVRVYSLVLLLKTKILATSMYVPGRRSLFLASTRWPRLYSEARRGAPLMHGRQ